MLDEAFSKSGPQFAQQALQAFRKFSFQLVIVATLRNATTIQPYIDQRGDGVEDQDDLGVHVAASRDARNGGAGAGQHLGRHRNCRYRRLDGTSTAA